MVSEDPATEQPVPVVEKVTPPRPEPPAADKLMGIPTVPVSVVFAIVIIDWVTGAIGVIASDELEATPTP